MKFFRPSLFPASVSQGNMLSNSFPPDCILFFSSAQNKGLTFTEVKRQVEGTDISEWTYFVPDAILAAVIILLNS